MAQAISPWESFSICLPHPYLTRYITKVIPRDIIASAPEKLPIPRSNTSLRLVPAQSIVQKSSQHSPPFSLHSSQLSFDVLEPGYDINVADNTPWARARRSPSTTIIWTSAEAPSIAQIWLLVYALFTVHYEEETIRICLEGAQTDIIRQELLSLGLTIAHPLPTDAMVISDTWAALPTRESVLLRSAFWQGAASPFGPRSAWTPSTLQEPKGRRSLESFPSPPATQTLTTRFPTSRIHSLHPIRPAKPTPGSIFYSRFIPHLNEHYSMIALDYENPIHLDLFHTWQNDPRIAAGWNETGTLSEHHTYLKNLHEDPHIVTVLAVFEDIPFAYFEIYWAKEDHLGAYYQACDFDRGRHSLVGDTDFRGPHRTQAWWSSLMHFMFLDDIRTEYVVGEPKWSNTRVHELDAEHGFHIEKWVDLPHKRSALMKCSRERFFGLCTVGVPWLGSRQKNANVKL